MSTYFEIWKANEALGQQAVITLALGSLLLVMGWLAIPLLLPARLQTIGRWGYLVVLFMLALLVMWRGL